MSSILFIETFLKIHNCKAKGSQEKTIKNLVTLIGWNTQCLKIKMADYFQHILQDYQHIY